MYALLLLCGELYLYDFFFLFFWLGGGSTMFVCLSGLVSFFSLQP